MKIGEQVGGSHYAAMKIQPSELFEKYDIPWSQANAIKYVCRYDMKGGVLDLEKAIHYVKSATKIVSIPKWKIWEFRDGFEGLSREKGYALLILMAPSYVGEDLGMWKRIVVKELEKMQATL